MPPRRRVNRNMIGNTRMDGALDAMSQLGFEKKLVQETVAELLDVYEGYEGWPFIEEGSYRLLIETILVKQQSFVGEKDGISDKSSTSTPTTKVGCSRQATQDSVLDTKYDLDFESKTSDHRDLPTLGSLDNNIQDMTLPTDRGTNGRSIKENHHKRKSDSSQTPRRKSRWDEMADDT